MTIMGGRIGANVAQIAEASEVDGPGVRTVVWFQGCKKRCPGCQNEALHGDGGMWLDAEELGRWLPIFNTMGRAAGSHLYTITGGEPFDQPLALALMLTSLKRHDPKAHVVAYTGHTWGTLTWKLRRCSLERLALDRIDILVDGPYIAEKDDDHQQYVGSSNQRVIDVRASLDCGELVLEDWTSNGMFTIEGGAVTMAGGWLHDTDMAGIGAVAGAPLCGQAERKE